MNQLSMLQRPILYSGYFGLFLLILHTFLCRLLVGKYNYNAKQIWKMLVPQQDKIFMAQDLDISLFVACSCQR